MITCELVNEQRLISELRIGNSDAFQELVDLHSDAMLRLAHGFLSNHDDAADAVQDAFLSAFKALDQFVGSCMLKTWLHRIVVNVCLMKLRAKKRRKTYSIDDLLPRFDETNHHLQPVAPWKDSPTSRIDQHEACEQVRRCIEQLPEDYQSVLVLRDIEGLDTEQTAKILMTTTGAVKTRLHRARQSLLTLLSPYMSCE
jgi:RNA polymerase sigma-70 factor (ECF subfamily)